MVTYTATWLSLDGNWFDADNWSDQNPNPPPNTTNGVPGADNDVSINNSGSTAYTVSYDGTDTVNTLGIQSENTLAIDGGSLSVLSGGYVVGTLNLASGATLENGTGTLLIANGDMSGTLAGSDIEFLGGNVSFNSGINLQQLATWDLGVNGDGFGVNATLNTNITYSGHFLIDDYSGNNATLNLNGHDLTLTGLAGLQGTFRGPGTVEITKSAVELSNYAATTVIGGAVLEEAAGATIVQQGNVVLGDPGSGTLAIEAGATYEVVNNANIGGDVTSEAILNNAGSFIVSGGVTAQIDATFDNTGTIAIDSGGELSDFYGSFTIGGTVSGPGTLFLGPNVATIATSAIKTGELVLAGNLDYGTDTTLDVNLTYGGTFIFNNEFAVLDPNHHTLTLTGPATLDAGTISGPGTVRIGGSATEVAASVAGLTIQGGTVLENLAHRTIVQQGNLFLGTNTTSGTLRIDSGSLYEVEQTAGIQGNTTSTAIIDNAGTFVVAGTGTIETVDATFDNTGTISVGSGAQLSDFYGSYVIGGAVTGQGTLFVGPANAKIDTANITVGTLYLGGNLDYGVDATLDVNLNYGGNFFFNNEFATLNLNKHTLTLAGDATLTGGGQVEGPGTLDVTGYAVISGVGYGSTVTTEIAGGTVHFGGGNSPTGKVTFANIANGTLIDDLQPLAPISGFVGGDAVDLTGTEFISGETVSWSQSGTSGTLTVVSGGDALATLHLTGHYTSADFATMADAGGGTVIEAVGLSRLYKSSSGIVVSRGEVLAVEAGGTAISATVQSGGLLEIAFGGLDHSTSILSGGSDVVLVGGTDIGANISAGGTLVVRAGGNADPVTIYLGGREIVSAGGSDLGALIAGGSQLDYGHALEAKVFTGAQVVEAGGVADATNLSGGTEIINAHGSDEGAQIAGGLQLDHGVADGDTIFTGAQVVESGGTASGTTISGGSEIVSAHGVDLGAQIFGGGQFVYGLATGATVFNGGAQTVDAAGIASGSFVSSGGEQIVSVHGLAERGQIVAGGSESVAGTDSGSLIAGGEQSVVLGGTAVGVTLVDGGVQDVWAKGRATGAVISSGGIQQVHSAGLTAGTVIRNDGQQVIAAAGTAAGTIVSAGGTQIVVVDGGGLASATTILSGGLEIVGAGATDRAARVSGGEQDVFGTATGVAVFAGGTQIVEDGGVASLTTVERGGLAVVEAGSIVSSVTVSSGGTLEAIGIDAGHLSVNFLSGATGELGSGAFTSTLKIGNGATIAILSGGTAFGGTILAGGTGILESGGVVTAGVSGSLVVNKGGTFEFVGVNANSADESISTLSGATVELGAGATYSGAVTPGVTAKILSGGLATGITVSAGALGEVLSGGVVSGSTVDSKATETVAAGGTAVDINIDSGGNASIARGGVLDVQVSATNSGTLVVSGAIDVAAGATLTLDGKTVLAAGGIVDTSGTVNIGGLVSGGTLFADGPAGLVHILGGAVVNGGTAEIGDGTVEIDGASKENVSFTTLGTGELELGGTGNAYAGKITGFGGVSGANTAQSIDFLAVNSGGGVSAVFVSAASHTSGTLEVKSGGVILAEVTLVGRYSTSSFQINSGIGGSVDITDPPLSVAGGAATTLASVANNTPSLINTAGAANVALFGSYMAALFATAEGQVTTALPESQPSQHLLARPA